MRREFIFYGGAREFVRYQGPEAVLHGPAETGKTISALWKLHLCAHKYPQASIVIARKTLTSIYSTVLQTFVNKVVAGDPSVRAFGGSKPQWFDYPRGARIWVAGLDNAGKILSAEHDLIYVNQIEELTLEDWETLTTRTTGRAGNMPYAQTIGDCNPSYPQHWMYRRDSLRLFYSRHQDNPVLFDPRTGGLTEQGKRTMAVLDALTGVRRQRLLDGKPAQAEGVVYEEWDESLHLLYTAQVPQCGRFVAGQDWGYTNAGVFGVWAIDGDGRMYLVEQVYQTRRTIDWWVERAQALQAQYGRFERVVCDPSEPAYIQQFRQAGLNAIPADNAVRPGIDAVKRRLNRAEDGKPRLFIVRASLRVEDGELIRARQPYSVQDEFPAYVWADKASREQPVKEHDHGLDMVRYVVQYLDKPGGGWSRGPAK